MSKHPLKTGVVLFTRDLRLHDHPALAAAAERAERILPLFVLDDPLLAVFGAPNRVAFLLDALGDLDASLRRRGGALRLRRGNGGAEACRGPVGAGGVRPPGSSPPRGPGPLKISRAVRGARGGAAPPCPARGSRTRRAPGRHC